MTRILHQLGHRFGWNLDSIHDENTGDGVICAPRYMARNKVVALSQVIKTNSLFDPQFYLPSSPRGELSSYSFFPQVVAGGFSTSEWNEEQASQCANECLRFQNENAFSALIIPTRFYEGMPSTFIQDQERLFVSPFLNAARIQELNRPLYLQLILTNYMLLDDAFRTSLLNWITSFPEISGVYLIYYIHNRGKQIQDTEFLLNLMAFIRHLRGAELRVIIGYTNTEGILLLCAGADAITIGSYENLRMFSPSPFSAPTDTPRFGPNVRIYIPRLLQWIEYGYLGAFRRVLRDFDDYLGDNQYRIAMFRPEYNWHFSKPEPYKHFFSAYSAQIRRLSSLPQSELCRAVQAEINSAVADHERLREAGILMDPESSGQHLYSWITAINIWIRQNE